MSAEYGSADRVRREIGAQFRRGTDKIVGPLKFAGVCKFLWPFKTAAHIAVLAGTSERTAERWLSGEFPFPIEVWIGAFAEMNKRVGADAGKNDGGGRPLKVNGQMDAGAG